MIPFTLSLAVLTFLLGLGVGIARAEKKDAIRWLFSLSTIALILIIVALCGWFQDRTEILADDSTISIAIPDGEYSKKELVSYPVEGKVVAPDFDAAALPLLGEKTNYERKGGNMLVTADGHTYIMAIIPDRSRAPWVQAPPYEWAIARIQEDNPAPKAKASVLGNGTPCDQHPGNSLPPDLTKALEERLGGTVTETRIITNKITYVKDGKAVTDALICTPWAIAVM